MSPPPDVEYKVILVFPGYGSERENAEDIVEQALDHLNIPNYEPGWRFAPNVKAHLEIVGDIEDARAKLESDDDLAMMILHGLSDEEMTGLTEECAAKGVPVCHSVEIGEDPDEEAEEPREKCKGLKVIFTKADEFAPRAHRISADTLTAPPEGDEEELGNRFGQIIAILALGVMEHHWNKQSGGFEGLGP